MTMTLSGIELDIPAFETNLQGEIDTLSQTGGLKLIKENTRDSESSYALRLKYLECDNGLK